MKIICIIPSRLHSTRLPRKPLLSIQGKPMIQWVYENAARSRLLSEVIVATDDTEIATLITNIGGQAVMTDPNIATGSERVAKVAASYSNVDVVINLQGDEPFIQPKMFEELVKPYLSGEILDMTTLAFPLEASQYHLPGVVKVVTDLQQNALYFSRAPIPYFRNQDIQMPVYHHMGIYAFRYDFLMHYSTLSPTPLEKIELLEQLRVLEHGYRIRVCLTQEKTLEVNTQAEYEAAQSFVYRH